MILCMNTLSLKHRASIKVELHRPPLASVQIQQHLCVCFSSTDSTSPTVHHSPATCGCRAQREHDRAMAAAAAAAAVASTTAAAASTTATAATASTTQHPGKRRRTDGASSWRKDTQAGFFLAEEDDGPSGGPREAHTTYQAKELAPEIDNPFYPAHPKCSDCGVEFWNSQLQVQFGVMVCDMCHKKHKDGKCVSSLGLSLCTNQDTYLRDYEKYGALLLSLQELAVTPGVLC